MTENETKAIKWIKNVRDDAVVTLDHIAKNEPNVSPMLYAGRKERAETIINGFEELERYRSIGTAKELKELKESTLSGLELAAIAIGIKELKKYEAIGTVEECREAVEKQRAKKPKSINKVDEETVYMECDNCGLTTVLYRGMKPDYCPKCGQRLNLQDCFNE